MMHVVSGSLNDFMDRAVKHYSSLFKLPPYGKMVLLLALLCIAAGTLSTIILFPFPDSVIWGLPLGFALLFMTMLSDYAVSKLILKHDAIYDIRRTAGLSIFCWSTWVFFIFLGVVVSPFFGNLLGVKLSLLGFSAVMIFRLTVLLSTSSADNKKLFVASLVNPILCYFIFVAPWASVGLSTLSFITFLAPVVAIGVTSSALFTYAISQVGVKMLGVSGLSIFKAFLRNWIANLNEPFEKILEELGESHDVEADLIKFGYEKPKAIMVVPSVHPGPFKNVGSSLLPFLIKKSLENDLQCTVCVPHGLLGHEFDLASQLQNEKMIKSIIENVDFEVFENRASPFVTVSDGKATACCQIFGKIAFISFTLAPKTTEDLPQELGLFVRQEAKKLGLECCIIVNAHNSINGTMGMDEALASLKEVAVSCLKKAASMKRLPFEVGAATVFPKEFGLKDGMGQGGITVIVVKVGQQKTAYIVIDGNNMVSGLREKILSTLHSMEVDEGEVFTTDTHSVNAIVLSERGYHPIGEVISYEKLMAYVKEAIANALSNIERVAVACRTITVSSVKVIGEDLLGKLCLLIDKALKRAKATAVPIFSVSGLLLMLILALV
jgi:putative membrane protein